MTAGRLLTLLHISDTHIAEIDPATGDGRVEPWVRDRRRRGRPWYGFLGHSGPALASLGALARRLREDEGALLVHSGDLTAWGAPAQFAAARDLLPAELGDLRALDLAIPGNHDHWPGDGSVFGRPSGALRSHFPSLPWTKRLPLGPSRFLTLAAIDSDADVFPWGYARAWGRGRFQSQLAALDILLPRPEAGELRVLLMHHSPWRVEHRLGVTRGSRAALDAFLARHAFRVILCGHVHVARAEFRRLPHGEVLEARCGTTLQRDYLPAAWAADRPLTGLPQNTLLVHRVFEEASGALSWRSELYRHGLGGFESGGEFARLRA